eukprot:1386337-Amphidinium_carterae.1
MIAVRGKISIGPGGGGGVWHAVASAQDGITDIPLSHFDMQTHAEGNRTCGHAVWRSSGWRRPWTIVTLRRLQSLRRPLAEVHLANFMMSRSPFVAQKAATCAAELNCLVHKGVCVLHFGRMFLCHPSHCIGHASRSR